MKVCEFLTEASLGPLVVMLALSDAVGQPVSAMYMIGLLGA